VTRAVESPVPGWVAGLDALAVGRLVMRLGGGRRRKGDVIDPRVGVVLQAKIGDRVTRGAPLATIHAADEDGATGATSELLAAYTISDRVVAVPPLILGEID
jgi:thymidine phosphorylase